MNSPPRRRDFWDIADVVAKIASSVFLAVLAYVIPTASQRIAASLDTARLVQTLIADLTTANEQTRQDLALIALNRSVGDHNSALVTEIAERIYFDLSARDTLQQGFGRVAFSVLASRDPERANFVKDSIQAEADSARGQIVSTPNIDSVGTTMPSPQGELIARIHSKVAYIQFAGERERALAEGLKGELAAAGFYAPGIDQVDGVYNNWIRYFHDTDAANAQRAKDIVERYLRANGREVQFRVQNLSPRGFRAPEGQIEVWMRFNQ